MDKQDTETTKKPSSTSNLIYPTFSELSRSTAIHGAVMGNLSGFREGAFLYHKEDGSPVHIYTQLVTYSRDLIRIYNVEIHNETTKNSTRKINDYRLSQTHELPLFGEVREIGIIHHPDRANKGFLVVLFKDNKVATLAHDSVTNSFSIIDLHNLENPGTDLLRKGQITYPDEFILKIDKFNRCVAILSFKQILTLMMSNTFYQNLGMNLSNDVVVHPNYASLNKESHSTVPAFYGITYYLNFADYNLNNPVDFEIVEQSKELRIHVLNQQYPVHRGPNVARSNVCEFVGFRINKSFFSTALWEKNKVQSSPKENIEIYSCCMKFKFLPSDCFKLLSLPKGGFLIIAEYAIYYFDIVGGEDRSIGFLVNYQYGNTDAYARQYYKCSIFNRKPECQINLRDYKFEILDSRHILLSGVGSFLLRLDLKKETLVENMELIRMPDLINQRTSFICTHPKPIRTNNYLLLLGSYMSNAQLVQMEVFLDPRVDFPVTKRSRPMDDRLESIEPQFEDAFFTLSITDTIRTLSPISDLIAPKSCNSNPFHLVASASYGKDSSILLMQTRVDLKLTEIWDVDTQTQNVISVKQPGGPENLTKYLLLSKPQSTEVLVCENSQLRKSNEGETLFLETGTTFQCKRLKTSNYSVMMQVTPSCIRFINSNNHEFHDVPVAESLDCQTKGNYICVLTAQRVLEIYSFWIPEDGVLSNMQLGQRNFSNENYMSNVACFSLFKRKRAFTEGWTQHDVVLAVVYLDHSIRLFVIKPEYQEPVTPFFYCPYINEGMPNLLNILDDEEKLPTLLTRIITSPSIPNPMNISSMKSSCNYQVEEIYLRELQQNLLIIIRISNGEYYFYRSYANPHNPQQRYGLGYSMAFEKIIYEIPLFTFPSQKQSSKDEMPTEDSLKTRSRTIFKHKYTKEKSCVFICIEDIYIWLFSNRNEIFFHTTRKNPQQAIRSLCDFNIPDCDIMFSCLVNNKLSVYGLDDLNLDYESSLPLKKVTFNKTIRNIIGFPHEEPRYLAFVASQKEEDHEAFSINLMEIKSQKLVSSIYTDANTRITKIKTVNLNINGKSRPLLVAVQYTSVKTLDKKRYAGRVSLYSVEKNELAPLHEIVFENMAVTDVFDIQGLLFVCQANKIQWFKISMREDLKFYEESVSYLFTEKFWIMDTLVLPNFLIFTDLRKSLSIYYWQPENPIKLTPKGDSYKELTLYATGYFDSLADNLRVVTADDHKNVALLSFSIANQKVDRVADFHVGALVTKFRRLRSSYRTHDAFLLSTNEGGLCFIGSYESQSHNNLVKLQNLMAIEFPFLAGLHHKAYRLYKNIDVNDVGMKPKSFLDGKLLKYYCHLSQSMQTKIAKKFHDTRENLLNHIYNLFSANGIF